MKLNLSRKILAIALVGMTFMMLAVPVFAEQPPECFDGDGNQVQAEINLNCQRARILDPQSSAAQTCELFLCPGREFATTETIDVSIFFVNIRLNSETAIGQALFIIFNVILGIVVLATVLFGIYGSYKRAVASGPDDIAESQKIITNAIIGFLMVGLTLVIIQVFASFIGVGSIFELVDFGPALPNT